MLPIPNPTGLPIPCFVVTRESPFDPDEAPPLCHVLDAKGWLVYHRGSVYESLSRPKDGLGEALGEAKPFTSLLTTIPVAILHQATAFFRAVHRKFDTEAALHLLYNPDEDAWELEPLRQTTESLSVNYTVCQPRRPGWQTVSTFHSHNRAGAFHSSVDDANEKHFDGVHVVVGNLDGNTSISCSLVVGGERYTLLAHELFDGLEGYDDFPEEWLNLVTKKATVTSFGGYLGAVMTGAPTPTPTHIPDWDFDWVKPGAWRHDDQKNRRGAYGTE